LFAILKNTEKPRTESTKGSIEEGLAAAEQQLSTSYTVAYIAHAPLEPRAAVAQWDQGRLTVWTGTQVPFGVQSELASAFGIPESQVRVIVPDTGSGYGGKHTGEAAVEAARLAKDAGRPVKLVWTREDEFNWAYARPAGVIEVQSGVRKDGTLTAWDFHNYNSGGSGIATLYDVPHQRVHFHPSQSPLRQGSYRGLAATANHFAREVHMDEVAHSVNKDPLELRLANLKDARLRAVLQRGADVFGWGKRKAGSGRGFGFGGGFEKGGYVSTFAEVSADKDLKRVRVERVVIAFECGAIVSPDCLRNQVEGGMIQGLGGALFEQLQFADGKLTNGQFSRYRVPRFADMPVIETVLVDRTDLPSAGAGETPVVGIAPAIGNAIFSATGVRLRSMPLLGSPAAKA
jgi:isoquinoline 1-oxidoreductase